MGCLNVAPLSTLHVDVYLHVFSVTGILVLNCKFLMWRAALFWLVLILSL
jgi:hypothetical protein